MELVVGTWTALSSIVGWVIAAAVLHRCTMPLGTAWSNMEEAQENKPEQERMGEVEEGEKEREKEEGGKGGGGGGKGGGGKGGGGKGGSISWEVRRLEKHCQDTPLAEDENYLGARMMKKWGWQQGRGLGRYGTGRVENVQAWRGTRQIRCPEDPWEKKKKRHWDDKTPRFLAAGDIINNYSGPHAAPTPWAHD